MKWPILSLSIAVLAGSLSPAAAQQAAPSPRATNAIGEVVITAERRTQSVQTSSLAIQVLSADAIADAGVTQIRDLTMISPGVNVGQGGPATQIYIRGVGDFGSTPTFNPAVATYIDGVYVPRANAIEGNLYDISRVEVLKGPQGTLYGRNAAGGALNILSNAPKLGVTNGAMNVEVGNYNEVNVDGFGNLALGDTLALRGAFQSTKHSGYSTMGFDDDEKQAFRVQALWQPNDDVKLRVGGAFTHVGGIGPGYNFDPILDPTLRTQLNSLGIAIPTSPRLSITDPRAGNVLLGIDALAAFLQAPFNTMVSNGSNPAATPGGGNVPGTTYCAPAVVLNNGKLGGVSKPLPQTTAGYCNIVAARVGVVNPNYYATVDPNLYQTVAHQNNIYWNLTAQLDWNLGFANLTVIPGYREVHNDYVTFPNQPYDNGGRKPEQSISKSLEARLAHDTKLVDWTVGGYLFQERQHQFLGQFVGENVGNGVGNAYSNIKFITSNWAVFTQETWHVAEGLRVITGLRYSEETKTVDGFQVLTYPNIVFGSRLDCQGSPNGECLQDRYKGRKFSSASNWKLGVEYDVAPRHMVYTTASTGYKAGGVNSIGTPNSGFNRITTAPGLSNGIARAVPYNPEKLLAVEVGSRNRFLDNRLQLNLEGFYYKYRDHQENVSAVINTLAGPVTVGSLQNVGDAKMYGGDIDIVYAFTQNDTVRFNAEYLHTKYDSFSAVLSNVVQGVTIGCPLKAGPLPGTFAINCAGKPLSRSPKWTGSAGYTHNWDLTSGARVDASGTAQFASNQYLNPYYLPQGLAPSYLTLNANVTYTVPDGNWTFQAFIRNITNDDVFTGSFQSPGSHPNSLVRNIGAPRTWGVRVGAKF